MKKKKIFDVIFRDKPVSLLVELYKSETEIYASTVSKKIDCTYSHVVKLLKEMNKAGLITFQRRGRLKLLNLTKKGEEVAKRLEQIDDLL